jgi:hypothetical protein
VRKAGGFEFAGTEPEFTGYSAQVEIGELMHDGQGILLDFDRNASLKTLASENGDRIKYITGGVEDRLGVSAVLIRPDGIIAWASDNDPDCSELQKAAARWFVSNAGIKH